MNKIPFINQLINYTGGYYTPDLPLGLAVQEVAGLVDAFIATRNQREAEVLLTFVVSCSRLIDLKLSMDVLLDYDEKSMTLNLHNAVKGASKEELLSARTSLVELIDKVNLRVERIKYMIEQGKTKKSLVPPQ